jgi:uncharacterized protein YdcH (DUF465 family)
MPITRPDDPMVKQLLDANPSFRNLFQEHKVLDQRVIKLLGKHGLTPAEELELATLKKKKLKDKDAMARMMADAAP